MLQNCIMCNRPFLKSLRKICPECIKIETDMVLEVRNYIKNNPNQSLKIVSEETGVDIKYINRFIREGRVDLSINCKKCGTKMKSTQGNSLCNTCKQLVARNIMSNTERLAMERQVCSEKIKELQQRETNNSMRKSLYGLGRGDENGPVL